MTLTTHDLQQIERALHLAWGKAIDAGDSATASIFYEACRLARKHAPQPTTPPADPMDWPLPCDVKVGHGTIGKGCSLRTLVTRMKVLYKMATGRDADAPVEPVTFADIDELAAKLAHQARLHGAAKDLLTACVLAEAFIAGFEDDPTQTGVPAALLVIRGAIAKALPPEATCSPS